MPPFETERLSDDRGVVVAGGWLVPAPSRTLRVTALAFEVFRRRRAVTDPPLRKNRNRADPRALAPLQSSHCCPGRTRPPLVGFVRRCVPKPRLAPQPGSGADPPSTDPVTRKRAPGVSRRASTPTYVAARFGCKEPSLQLVPSSWFCTTSTVSSARRSRACCIPLPVMGFAAFLEAGSRSSTWQARSWREVRNLPRDALHTPRRHHRLQPYHVTVAVAPLPLAIDPARLVGTPPLPAPSLRAPPDRSLDFEAFLRRRIWTPRDRFQSRGILSFHGLCSPSRSLPDRTRALMPTSVVSPMTKIRRKPSVSATSSVPHLTASVRCKPRPVLLAEDELGGDTNSPTRRSERGHWHQTPLPFRRTTPAGKHHPARRRLAPRSRSVSRHEDERGRVPEAVGIPSTVHRESVGCRSSRA
jgi:hypothetical protein